MNELKVTSDIIRDLIPLVKDGVASTDSVQLVEAGIQLDEQLKAEFEQYDELSFESKELDLPPALDMKIISAMKRSFFMTQMLILIAGTAIGIAVTNSFEMMYNFLLMPFIGALAIFSFKSKWKFIVPIAILAITFVWQLTARIIIEDSAMSAFADAIFFSIVYALLSAIGLVIGLLLKYAFGKEKDHYE